MMQVPTPFYKLHCNGIKLKNKDGLFGKSDPFVVIYNSHRVPIGFSEVIQNNLNPVWKPIELDVEAAGGMNNPVIVEVNDFDNDRKHDLIGAFTCSVRELVESRKEHVLVDSRKKKGGKFVVSKADLEQKPRPLAYDVTFTASGLPRMDGLMGKSDPFLQVYAVPKSNPQGYVIARTKYIKNDLSPTWESIQLTDALCHGHDSPIIIKVYDYDSDGTHDYIGEVPTTLRQLSTSPLLVLINDYRKKQSSGYVNSGIVKVPRCTPTAPTLNYVPVAYRVSLKGNKLANMDFGGKSDPYITIKSGIKVIHKSEIIKNDLNPVWSSFTLSVQECGGMHSALEISVYDSDNSSKDDLIGKTTQTLRELCLFNKLPAIRLVNPKKKGNLGYKNSGFLVITAMEPLQTMPGHGGHHGGPSGHGMPQGGAPGYGAPQGGPGYGAPQGGPGYGAPGYGAPQRDINQGGAPGYGAPGYGAPQGGAPGYGAPQNPYGAVPQGGAPGYGAPGYGAPQGGAPGYGAPQNPYGGGAPQNPYGAVPQGGAPGYGATHNPYGGQ